MGERCWTATFFTIADTHESLDRLEWRWMRGVPGNDACSLRN